MALIHVLGNLTLVNDKLNPALSNGPWESKRPELAKHSVLRLNHEILDDARPWTDSRVVERGIELAKRVVRLWPGPEPGSIDYDALNPLALAEVAARTAVEPEAPERLSTMQLLLDAGCWNQTIRCCGVGQNSTRSMRRTSVPAESSRPRTASSTTPRRPAASHLAEGSVNGWQAWCLVRLGDRRLSEVRDELD